MTIAVQFLLQRPRYRQDGFFFECAAHDLDADWKPVAIRPGRDDRRRKAMEAGPDGGPDCREPIPSRPAEFDLVAGVMPKRRDAAWNGQDDGIALHPAGELASHLVAAHRGLEEIRG